MQKYDPLKAPDPAAWLAMDELERIAVVEEFHRRSGVRLPNRRLHAAMHSVVENQIAEGGESPTGETLARLMAEGLDRHEAIHAIATVLADHMHKLMSGGKPAEDPNVEYTQNLQKLTAEQWRHSAD